MAFKTTVTGLREGVSPIPFVAALEKELTEHRVDNGTYQEIKLNVGSYVASGTLTVDGEQLTYNLVHRLPNGTDATNKWPE